MNLPGLTDTHLHLHFPQYDADRAEVIQRALKNGFSFLINIGTDLEDSRRAIAIAEEYPEVYAAVGYHPHETKTANPEDLEELAKLLAHPKVVAIGEVGLDYFHDHSPRDVQEKLFQTFLDWCKQYQKPIIIHCRDAYADLLRTLRGTGQTSFRGVLHCFSSTAETMMQFLELGFYIAFGGALTYKKNDSLREACRLCPEDRLLLETDAPYLAPQSKRGQRNEPLFMMETAEFAAGLRGVSTEKVAASTTVNAKRLFGL
ncbi:MAG TPA: TatD family hydrolase [Candidatus Omnitrophota bacterium]|nr:TatD family hydrolase [Candidatus Omnitrophota bacterium]